MLVPVVVHHGRAIRAARRAAKHNARSYQWTVVGSSVKALPAACGAPASEVDEVVRSSLSAQLLPTRTPFVTITLAVARSGVAAGEESLRRRDESVRELGARGYAT